MSESMEHSAAELAAKLEAAGTPVGAEQSIALTRFLALLQRWNRVYNLTGIKEWDALIEHHLAESLALRPLVRGERIADVGSGAGVPGIPLAITEGGRAFTLIESRAKRARFLRHAVGELSLANVSVAHTRIEGLPCAQPFDTVLARGVAPLGELIRMTRHVTGPGSRLIVLTGAGAAERVTAVGGEYAVQPVDPSLAGRVRGSVLVLQR
jgi:16S rRNA (guanine527-N7)-methyltransferase